ncbi:MAG: 50S ribosomal protein L21 [Anaerolineae bacterium]|nr:50S ribosomal protein L21 [Anaerolineae bacterium]MDW8299201.1 50S ribosomal protein L21 [Anaerolineae bacterium]
MYAVVRTSGRQYRVAPNMVIDVDKLDAEAGTSLTLNEVLLVVPENGAPVIGRPLVDGVAVQATVLGHYRAKKIIVWKYRPGLRYRRRRGHRQTYTRLKIESITGI